MHRQYGLSLIELMVALAIALVVLGVALPGVGGVLERHRAAAAHNLLLASIQHARTTAVTERRSTVVCPSRTGTQCDDGGTWEAGWIAFIDANRNARYDAGEQLLRRQSDGIAGLRVRSGASRPQVRFHRDGRSAGSNLSIRLCAPDGRPLQAIVINNGGRARAATREELPGLAACI